jgi:hypothetical protein
VSTESTTKDLDHPSDHHEEHHSKGATFVDPLGSTTIEEGSHAHGAEVQSVAMLEGAQESSAQAPLPAENSRLASDWVDPTGLTLSLDGLNNTKVTSDNADQWIEEIKIRMDKLRQDVDELNARLDRFKRPIDK